MQSTETKIDENDNKENTITTHYFYGNGLNAQGNGKDYFVYHFNNVGSTMAVTDAKGGIVEQYNYTPYGELITGQYRDDILFLYNGQYGVITDNNGLYYMRARYYNVEIKRFINQDVLLGVLERISSLNRYAYVEGNPVSYLDPFGLDRIDTSGWHKLAAILSMVLNVASIIPGGRFIGGLAVTVDLLDIGLSVIDLKYAIIDNDKENAFLAAYSIATHIITIVSTIIGFNIEPFYNKISSFTGWGNAKTFLYNTEITTNAYRYYSTKIGASSFAANLTSLILDVFI